MQHILAAHSKIASSAEPWVLFPGAIALRPGAIQSDYDAGIGQLAILQFLDQLDAKESAYYLALRNMALTLYDLYRDKQGKEYFLDKTTRNYMILPELFKIFPDAHYIFLNRNPLAIFDSYLETMVSGNWTRLGNPGIRNDLLDGFRLLRQGIKYLGDDAITLKYENLVTDSNSVIQNLCSRIGINFEPKMVQYGSTIGVLPGKLVDPKSIHKHSEPVLVYADAWRTNLRTPQESHFACSFLENLGTELVEESGYRYEELYSLVCNSKRKLIPMIKWEVLMTPPKRRSYLQNKLVNGVYLWQTKGFIDYAKNKIGSLAKR